MNKTRTLLLIFVSAGTAFGSGSGRDCPLGLSQIALISDHNDFKILRGGRACPTGEIRIRPGLHHTSKSLPRLMRAWRLLHAIHFVETPPVGGGAPGVVRLSGFELLAYAQSLLPRGRVLSYASVDELPGTLHAKAADLLDAHSELAEDQSVLFLAVSKVSDELFLQQLGATVEWVTHPVTIRELLTANPSLDGVKYAIQSDGGVEIDLATGDSSLWQAAILFESPLTVVHPFEGPQPQIERVYFGRVHRTPAWKVLLFMERQNPIREIHVDRPTQPFSVQTWTAPRR